MSKTTKPAEGETKPKKKKSHLTEEQRIHEKAVREYLHPKKQKSNEEEED